MILLLFCNVIHIQTSPAPDSSTPIMTQMENLTASTMATATMATATMTTPATSHVSLKASRIPGAGMGVWSNKIIKRRTRFGPFPGIISSTPRSSPQPSVCWPVGNACHVTQSCVTSHALCGCYGRINDFCVRVNNV